MSVVTAHIRRSEPRHASLAVRRLLLGYLVALCAAPVITLGVLLAAGNWDHEASASRVVEVRCFNGRIQHGIETGRPDGLLLATDSGEAC